MTTIRVEKRKWDGTVAAVDTAYPLAVTGDCSAWFVPAGSRRKRPRLGSSELVDTDELWVAMPGGDDAIVWIDLDLDFDVTGDEVALQDEAQFDDHARTMGYTDEVVRGAWSGISTIAARYTNGEWPFDGSMQEWVDGA